MVLNQINRQRFDVRAILNAGVDLGWKLSAVRRTAARANLVEKAMFSRFQFERWQIKDLSFVTG